MPSLAGSGQPAIALGLGCVHGLCRRLGSRSFFLSGSTTRATTMAELTARWLRGSSAATTVVAGWNPDLLGDLVCAGSGRALPAWTLLCYLGLLPDPWSRRAGRHAGGRADHRGRLNTRHGRRAVVLVAGPSAVRPVSRIESGGRSVSVVPFRTEVFDPHAPPRLLRMASRRTPWRAHHRRLRSLADWHADRAWP